MLVFQHFVWDRLEACALAVLPLLICEQVRRVFFPLDFFSV